MYLHGHVKKLYIWQRNNVISMFTLKVALKKKGQLKYLFIHKCEAAKPQCMKTVCNRTKTKHLTVSEKY